MRSVLLLIIFGLCLSGCDDIIEVVDISNNDVAILAPTDRSVLNTTSVNFTWNPIENAESYHLQIATPSFENATQIIEDTLITKTNYSKTLEATNYQWRIRAENSEYQTVYATTSFSIEDE